MIDTDTDLINAIWRLRDVDVTQGNAARDVAAPIMRELAFKFELTATQQKAFWLAVTETELPPQEIAEHYLLAAKSPGTQTLDNLPSGPAPEQLAPPFLSAEGVTVIYGLGGAGKGYVAMYLALRLVRSGKRLMIIDYEGHPGEWGRRSRAIGFTQAEREMVNYRAPFGEAWTAKRGSLHDVAAILRADVEASGSDYIIIDSYTTATSTGDSMGGAAAAQEFFGGIATIGRPALVIAHVAGGGEQFPDKPFGSIFVHNLARETWATAQLGDRGEPRENDTGTQTGRMTIELRNKKSNGRPKSPPQFLTFNFDLMDTVRVDEGRPGGAIETVDLIADVLVRSIKPLTTKEIIVAIKADTDIAIPLRRVNEALGRHKSRFNRTNDVPFRYELRGAEKTEAQAPKNDLNF